MPSDRKNFTLSQAAKALKQRNWLYRTMFFLKSIREPSFSVKVKDLLAYAGVSDACLNDEARKSLEKTVKQVCGVGVWFYRDCICAQLYNVDDDDLRWACANGAHLLVADHQVDNLPCAVVEDPMSVFARMCRYYRELRKVHATVVTGSIGKTTTKNMVNAVYSAQYETLCNSANYNLIYSVGQHVQHIPRKTTHFVQEISEDTPGGVKAMATAVYPEVAVITAIDKSHMEAFGSQEGIVKEICSITQAMPENGTVIVDKDIFDSFDLLSGRKFVTVSTQSRDADFYSKDVHIENSGLVFTIVERSSGHESVVRFGNIYAEHNVISALLAFAAGVVQGVSYENAVKGLEGFRTDGMRQNVLRSKDDIIIYADCYNAVAESVRSAVHACEKIPVRGRRIAVLGDIAEAGDMTDSMHEEIVSIANQSGFDVLVAVGEHIAGAVNSTEMRPGLEVHLCKDNKEATAVLRKIAVSGDLVLLKASHSIALDKCIRSIWPEQYKEAMDGYLKVDRKVRLKMMLS